MARGNSTTAPRRTGADQATVGPPLLILALGFASVVASVPLLSAEGIAPHVVGYLTGGLLPILVVGLVRRIDLDRRRNHRYQAKAMVAPALLVLLVAAMVMAGLHIWPIATELAT